MHLPRRLWKLVAVAGGLPVLAAACAVPGGRTASRDLKVMTRNLYLGADLRPLFAAQSTPALAVAVTAVYAQVQASDFPERAVGLADEIVDARPLLVGLQEVSLWRTDSPSDGAASPAETVGYDFLDLLLAELTRRGATYRVAVTTTSFDAEVPSTLDLDVRLTDRDVILERTGADGSATTTTNVQERHYNARLVLPTAIPGVSFTAVRGWNSVDLTWRGTQLRFVNTHLEAFSDPVQQAQVAELLAALADSPIPVVLVGDLNSPADGTGSSSYAAVVAAGFTDAWSQTQPGKAGFTCCHGADLRNPLPTLTERIDLVMYRGGRTAVGAEVVGESAGDRTPAGRWPSDHAGVVVTLR